MNTTTATAPIIILDRGLYSRVADHTNPALEGRALVWGPRAGTCACGRGCKGRESSTRSGVFGEADAWAIVAANTSALIETDAPVAVAEVHTGNPSGQNTKPAPVAEPMDPRADEAMAWLVANAASNEFALSVLTGWNKFGRPTPRQMEAVLRNVDRDAARKPVVAAEPVAPKADAAEGWYRFGTDIYKVQLAVHGSGKPYAKRLVVAGFGEATWEYEAGMVRRLTPEMALTVEEAARFGTLYGVCAVCGRTLTDEVSIAAGIGPVCRGRLG